MLAENGAGPGDVTLSGGLITRDAPEARVLEADGLFVLPGIVDVHGDAFERQMMPRPGVGFDIDLALAETDRQVVANGITTVFHAVTWSWEPGLRGTANAHAVVSAIARSRSVLAADTRAHMRHETFNLEAEPTLIDWMRSGLVSVLAFNDHMAGTIKNRRRADKLATMVQRCGLSAEAFDALIERVWSRREEVRPSIERLAGAARAAGLPMMSHDDDTPATRRWFRGLGVTTAEFPMTVETAAEAAAAGESVVFGAPNVVRGGSHVGFPTAAEMVAQGRCTVLASDYYHPAPLVAAFRLVRDGIAPLERAWPLVSSGAAGAVGLADRGRIVPGARGDVILVDSAGPLPRVVATFVAGRLVHLTEPERLTA